MDTGPITLPPGRKEYFLVAVDSFTKWVEVLAVSAENGVAIASLLQEEFLKRHSCTERLLTNNSAPYVGPAMREEFDRWGLHHHTLVTYHPKTNSLAKKTNGTLKRIMEKLADGSRKK